MAVYLFHFLHERIIRPEDKRHIIIRKFMLCRHHHFPTVTSGERPLRIYDRQRKRSLHKRINPVEMRQFEKLGTDFVKAAQNRYILNADRRKELNEQFMFV